MCLTEDKTFTKASFETGEKIGRSVNVARDLANSPANVLTPKAAVDKVKTLFKGKDISIKVIDEKGGVIEDGILFICWAWV